ncbi:hypothetical protein E6C70_14475 [Glaciibacter flavus]|uniref:Uncharacterized protein n=1 Tax=Orlajensenia flava TaxID=2565934 RepID=A0A4S4FK99_9MICO|nr:hypothetical protein [Glaciibacter flavus]THG30571.1 hypothetical protein E6C70_14475 [Glaciibacter flavus]
MPEIRRDHSLWLTLVVCIVVVVGGGIGLLFPLAQVKNVELAAGLTNVATIGGIVSGLSLSGTAVLSLSGRYTLRILERYGSAIRFVLFGGFAVLVTASLLCAVSVMWADEQWPRYVLAFTVPLMLITLLATALLINSAFARERDGNNPKALAPSPYK